MAFKCKGDWDSWVTQKFPPSGEPNDGSLAIGAESVTGKFKGKHKKKPKPEDPEVEFDLDGDCDQLLGHHIEFTTSEGFKYEGDISEKMFQGNRKDVAEGTRKRGRGEEVDSDDWVAVKVT
jgi:hypothetical protein